MLGERGIGKVVQDEIDPESLDAGDDESAAKTLHARLHRTQSSARDESEVEEVVGLFDGDDDAFLDDDRNSRTARTNGHERSPVKSPTKKRYISPSDDSPPRPHRGTRSPRKPVGTPANISREIVAGSSRSRKLFRSESIARDRSPRSPPIESPTNRKARQRQVNEESDSSLVPRKKRKLLVRDEDDGQSEPEAGGRKTKMVQKMKAKPVMTLDSDEDEEGTRSRASPAHAHTTPNSKAGANPSLRKSTNVAASSTHTPASPIRPQTSPRRVPSVVIQTTVKSVLARNNSSVAIAPETPSRKRERPTPHKAPSPVPSTSDVSTTLFRASTKRTAATKAIQKLHDEVMPDVLNFQQEMRSRTKGKGKERLHDRSRDEDNVSAVKAKYKVKGRGSDARQVGTPDEERRTVKKRRTSRGGEKSVKAALEDYESLVDSGSVFDPRENGTSHGEDDDHVEGNGRSSKEFPASK